MRTHATGNAGAEAVPELEDEPHSSAGLDHKHEPAVPGLRIDTGEQPEERELDEIFPLAVRVELVH